MSAGDDVAAMLPCLSRRMGHGTFESMYYYVHTSPDFMAAYADITRNANPCYRRWDSNETRPTYRRTELFRFARDFLHAYCPRREELGTRTIEATG